MILSYVNYFNSESALYRAGYCSVPSHALAAGLRGNSFDSSAEKSQQRILVGKRLYDIPCRRNTGFLFKHYL